MRKKLDIVFLALFLCIAAFAGWKLIGTLLDYKQEADFYSGLEQRYLSPSHSSSPVLKIKPADPQTAGEIAIPFPATNQKPPIEVDFSALQQMNPEIIGWIYVEGTPINYPITQCDDNVTYLFKRADGQETGGGSIFLDCGSYSDFTGDNSILYGHHMKDGSMFAILSSYADQGFFDAHPDGWLLTPTAEFHIIFYSAQVVDARDWAFTVNFDTRGEKDAYIASTLRAPLAKSKVIPSTDDRIVMLSTCSYEYDDARAAVYGILEFCEY